MNFFEVPYRFAARTVVLDGYRVAYAESNSEAPDPVLCLHGVGGNLDWFSDVYAQLSLSRRVIGLDWPGFGKSDKPQLDDPVHYYIGLLRMFLDEMGIPRASLVGHSMGALVAAHFAVLFPDRVDRLVLSSLPGVRPLADDAKATIRKKWSYEQLRQMDKQGRREWYESMVASWNERLEALITTETELASDLAHRQWAHACEEAIASVLEHPLGDQLARIEAPTLLIWGVDDRTTPFESSSEAREKIPGAQLVAIDRCGHYPMFERPEAFVYAMVGFLATGGATAGAAAAVLARKTNDIEPWPGLSPETGRIARVLFSQRQRIMEIAGDLSVEQVAWRPLPGAYSIGMLINHVGAMTAWYLHEMLLNEPVPRSVSTRLHFDAENLDTLQAVPLRTADRLINEVQWIQDQLAEWLRDLTDADLNRTFSHRDGKQSATLRWILWYLVSEAVQSRGQVAYVKRLLREAEKGYAGDTLSS
jgi:pimeloyl-ACP methyl ester carboxylesterase/uncharacterized damage-inducible protein DinB